MNKLRRWSLNAIAGVATAVASVMPSFGQTHDFNLKARELTHGQGSVVPGVDISLVDQVNNLQYLGRTNSNGEAAIQDVKQGNYQVTTKKEGYIEFVKANYTVDADKQGNVSLIKKIREGPWGTDNFDVAFYKSVFPKIRGPPVTGRDPPHRFRLTQINNKIVGADAIDSTILKQIEQNIQQFTGYDLINYVNAGDSLHTIYANSNTNTSGSTILQGIIIESYSQMTKSELLRQYFHEIVYQFCMQPPIEGNNILRPTVMDPDKLSMTDPQIWDYDNLAVTTDEHFAVKRGEQNIFNMFDLKEFSPFTTPTGTTILMPTNGATNVPTSVEIKAAMDLQAKNYRLQISKNSAFTDLILDTKVFRNDTTINNLPAGTQLYIRENVSNDLGTTNWSPTISITTLAEILMPGVTAVTKPANNAVDVPTPNTPIAAAEATNATQYRYVGKDKQTGTIVLDTLVNSNTEITTNRFKGNKTYTLDVTGKNNNGYGPTSISNTFTTFDNAPTVSTGLPRSTDIIEASQSTAFTYMGADKDNDPIKFDIHLWNATSDITINDIVELTHTLPANTLKSNSSYNYTITAKSGTKQTTSAIQTFNTFNNAPTIATGTPTSTDVLDTRQPTVFTYVASDKDNDPLAFSIHLWSATSDTTMNGITGLTHTLPENRLKEKTQYSYTITANDGTKQTTTNVQTFNTKEIPIVVFLPGATAVTKPANNAVDVPTPNTPIAATEATNATQYRYVGKDKQTGTIVLDTLVNSNTETTTNRFKGNKTYTLEVSAKNNNGYGPVSATNTFTTYNNAPGNWSITEPSNNAVISFFDKKAKITGTPSIDIDNDIVSKKYYITGADLDTIIFGANNEPVYIDSARLKPDTQYIITAEATDGSKSTPAELIIFKTPKAITGIDDFEIIKNNMIIYPNPNPKYIKFNQNIEGVTTIDLITISGQLLRHVYKERQPPGDYLISIDKEGLATGMYLIRKTTQGSQRKQVETGKAIIKE